MRSPWEETHVPIQFTKDGRNPRTNEEARAFVSYVESLFMPWNVEALVTGFTEDCLVRFGTVPEFSGRAALRSFFMARSAKQKGYRLQKRFRTLINDVMANVWDGEWEDATTGRRMRGFGVELWTMRDGKIAVWEAAFNTGPVGQSNELEKMLC
jgi:nuclear transport factor 2 (NTF2) superfamily protein